MCVTVTSHVKPCENEIKGNKSAAMVVAAAACSRRRAEISVYREVTLEKILNMIIAFDYSQCTK